MTVFQRTQIKAKAAPSANQVVEEVSLTVKGTDGTEMLYEWSGGAYRVSQITDRNGNYITVEHDELGLLQKVTDTLGREINVNYVNGVYPKSITQTWKTNNGAGSNTTHTWAEFDYVTIAVTPDFDPGLTVVGPTHGAHIKALEMVTYADGSSTKFTYNDYAQIWKIANHAPNDDLLNLVRTDLQTPASDQEDVPRFTTTWTKAANFNTDQYGVPQEIKTEFTRTPSSSFSLPGSLTGSGTLIEIEMDGHPFEAVSKVWYGESGWKEGLVLATEDWAKPTTDGSFGRQRWTWTDWAQDDTGAGIKTNPRVTETRVGDTANTKKTQIDYLLYPTTTISQYGLVSEVRVYDSDLSTVLKKQQTDYNLDSAYTNARIIGLPEEVRLKDGSDTLWSKVTYGYDEDEFDEEANQVIAPIRHDTENFDEEFVVGRGNLTSVTRHDVLSQSSPVTTTMRYDIAGSPVARLDPLGRKVRMEYTDAFNDESTPGTFAYPTKVYDPANNYSSVKYRFDIGANVEATSPAPDGQTYGKTTKRIFDSVGRLEKNSVFVNTTEQAYTRYEYPSNSVHSKVFSTITDTNSNGPDAADEVLSETWTDGVGRVRFARTPHTFSSGSTVTWAGTITEYDVLGRVARQSVPTEVDGSWDPAGDDYARGYLWTHQRYDWMGRVVRKINTDGDPQQSENDSDIFITYEGCGCAGGLITTIEGENVFRDDQPTVKARRKQKTYADILGREWKTVLYKWDGSTAFTTTEHFFDGRDQVIKTKQTDNTSVANPQTFREVISTFDGHGRLKTRHYPIEDDETETTWNYNADDSVSQITDPRGVITNLTYNSRGLTTEIAYTPPVSPVIPDSPTVTFAYDDLGNRTSMDTDGVSEVTYTYDSLSRLTSETIDFDDISTDYTITYSYDPDGSLKTLTEPFGGSFEYVRDKKGRLTDLNGTAFGGNMSGEYLTDVKYRAFGKVKEAQQSGLEISTQYDERLRISQNQVYNGSTYLLKAEYEYYADSQISHTDNQVNDLLDQWYQYDYAGRLSYNNFGSTQNSNDETITTYTQALYYNGFSEMTDRDSTTWNVQSTFGRAMTNGRLTAIGNEVLDYDASGNILRQEPNDENWQASVFDAAGRKVSHEEKWRRGGPISGQPLVKYHGESTILYDGDGRSVRQEWEKEFIQNGTPSGYSTSSRSIHSTVLGSEIASIEDVPYGERRTTNVFAGGAIIAELLRWTPTGESTSELYYWITSDPITGSRIKGGVQEDFEPLGQKIDPIPPLDDPTFPGPSDGYNDARFSEWQCKVSEKFNHSYNEMPAHCQKAYNADIWAKIYAIWPAWKEKEGNLSKLVDSPIINWSGGASVPNSLARRSMTYAMFTTKKDDGPYDGGHLGTVEAEPYEEPLVVMPDISGYVDVSMSSNAIFGDACDRALAAVKKDRKALSRALQNWSVLEQVDKKYGIHASVLAAIGIRESGFDPVKEDGNSKGIGIFQIDMRFHSKNISVNDAMNIDTSADYMGKILRNWYDDHVTAMTSVGYSLNGENSLIAIAAAIHSYNSGKAYSRNYDKNNKGQFIYKLDRGFKDALDGKKVSPLDNGTTHSNYVSTVWDIAIDCFGFNKR